MMQLSCPRDKTDLPGVLDNIDLSKIVQVIECHGTEDDDTNYVFMIWAADDSIEDQLTMNGEIEGAEVHEVAPCLFMWIESVC